MGHRDRRDQRVWKRALALSTVGVLVASLLTGLEAAWVLKLPYHDIGGLTQQQRAKAHP